MDRNDGNNLSIYTKWWDDKGRRNYKLYSAGNRWINQRIKDIVTSCLINKEKDIKSITDIGSGDGSRLYFLSHCFPVAAVTGIDFVQAAVDQANRVYGGENLHFVCADVCDIDIDSEMVSAFGVLEHIPNWKGAIDSWLKNTNVKFFLCYFPTGKLRKNEIYVGHVNEFAVGEVEEYLETGGWTTLAATYGGFPFQSPIFRTLQYLSVPQYEDYNSKEISGINRVLHEMIYFLFRYCSCQKKKGDDFIGLFERVK